MLGVAHIETAQDVARFDLTVTKVLNETFIDIVSLLNPMLNLTRTHEKEACQKTGNK